MHAEKMTRKNWIKAFDREDGETISQLVARGQDYLDVAPGTFDGYTYELVTEHDRVVALLLGMVQE